MPVKKDAEAATGQEDFLPAAPEAAGNIESELSDIQALVLAQQQMIERMGEQIDTLSKSARSTETVPKMKGQGPPPLPEGWRRYAARFTELTMIRVPGKRLVINGEKVFQEAVAVDFSGGVFETDDQDTIAWLESHDDFNQTFWVDDYAVRRHSMVEVQQGVKTVDQPKVAREPLSAPMT